MKSMSAEMISAWLDGEVTEKERAEIEAAIAASPELGVQVAKLARADRLLAPAFEETLNAPIPARFEALFEKPRMDRGLTRFTRALTAVLAPAPIATAAASLVLGLFLGGAILAGSSPGAGVASDERGRMLAEGTLATTLASLPSGATEESFRVRLSVIDGGGRYCRQFETVAVTGLACLENDGWIIETLQRTSANPGISTDYILADGAADPAISAAIERVGVRQVLDSGQEAAAIASGWTKKN